MIVASTDFRNNYAMFMDQLLAQGGVIKIKRGRDIIARLVPETDFVKTNNNWNDFWIDLKKIWSKQKANKKTNYSMKVDEILYGA